MDKLVERESLTGFASGLSIHQEDFPVPSFCTRTKRLWSERLWRMEFCGVINYGLIY